MIRYHCTAPGCAVEVYKTVQFCKGHNPRVQRRYAIRAGRSTEHMNPTGLYALLCSAITEARRP